jgi:hypothetical protein
MKAPGFAGGLLLPFSEKRPLNARPLVATMNFVSALTQIAHTCHFVSANIELLSALTPQEARDEG